MCLNIHPYTVCFSPSFDLMTNGGIAVTLHLERTPFITQEHTFWLPWGRFFVMDTIIMRKEENDIPTCDFTSFTRPTPVMSPALLTAFAGSCSERRTVVPEIQVTALHLITVLQMIHATHQFLKSSSHTHITVTPVNDNTVTSLQRNWWVQNFANLQRAVDFLTA